MGLAGSSMLGMKLILVLLREILPFHMDKATAVCSKLELINDLLEHSLFFSAGSNPVDELLIGYIIVSGSTRNLGCLTYIFKWVLVFHHDLSIVFHDLYHRW